MAPEEAFTEILQVVDIPKQILKVKQEVETKFLRQLSLRHVSPSLIPVTGVEEDAGRDNQNFNRLENEQEPNSQYGRGPIANQGVSSSTHGPAPALVKADVPWSVQRGTLSDKDHAFKIVKG
ncbi:hypothetical protein Tco_1142567 [Tanacetum coccineum]